MKFSIWALWAFLGLFGCDFREEPVGVAPSVADLDTFASPDAVGADVLDRVDAVEREEDGDSELDADDGQGDRLDTGLGEDSIPSGECGNDAPCNDLDPCTVDLCDAGECVYTPVPDCCVQDAQCDDGIPCTGDTCNAFTNVCEHVPEDNFCCVTAADCEDFDPCSDDLCIDHQCIFPQVHLEACKCVADALCDDGNPCTADSCDAGVCVYSPVAGAGCCANEGCAGAGQSSEQCVYNLCWTGVEICDSHADCTPPTGCWEGLCGEGGCVYTAKPGCCHADFECDDGLEATTDQCIAQACVHALGESVPCSTDAECLPETACSVGTCTAAGICSFAGAEGEGCCDQPSDCPAPTHPCAEATCVAFACGEMALTGFQPKETVTFDVGTLEGWTEESNGAGAYWHWSDYQSPEGQGAMYFGQDDAINYDVGIAKGSVQSPEFLPDTGKVALRFDRIAHVEPISSRDLFWLDLLQGDSVIEIWNKNANNGPGLGWKTEVLDLSDVAGTGGFRLRFSFDSVDSKSNQYEGLYVDNVAIGTLCEEASEDVP